MRLAMSRNAHRQPKIRTAFVYSVIDDHSRIAYAEIHNDETTAVGMLLRAVSWFAARGAVNDFELVAPAAGFDEAIAVIVGTGSKVIGRTANRERVSAGGHRFLFNDPGSAPGLARAKNRSE